jgi:hypothetical protein
MTGLPAPQGLLESPAIREFAWRAYLPGDRRKKKAGATHPSGEQRPATLLLRVRR